MNKQRRHFADHEKVAILKRHLVEKVPVSDLCDELDIYPNQFYDWLKKFFGKIKGVRLGFRRGVTYSCHWPHAPIVQTAGHWWPLAFFDNSSEQTRAGDGHAEPSPWTNRCQFIFPEKRTDTIFPCSDKRRHSARFASIPPHSASNGQNQRPQRTRGSCLSRARNGRAYRRCRRNRLGIYRIPLPRTGFPRTPSARGTRCGLPNQIGGGRLAGVPIIRECPRASPRLQFDRHLRQGPYCPGRTPKRDSTLAFPSTAFLPFPQRSPKV